MRGKRSKNVYSGSHDLAVGSNPKRTSEMPEVNIAASKRKHPVDKIEVVKWDAPEKSGDEIAPFRGIGFGLGGIDNILDALAGKIFLVTTRREIGVDDPIQHAVLFFD